MMWRPTNRSPAKRILYVMAKPPSALADQIAALPRAWRSRSAELLHITVQPLFDLRSLPPEILPRAIAWCEALRSAPPFRVTLDCIRESASTVSLRGSAPGAAAFHRAVRDALMRDGFPVPPYRFDPHVTIAYRPDGKGNEAIAPIAWDVEELLLVESVVGEARHVVHGRWPLQHAPLAA
jgi:RNA 2',3'-cyclic 3'-phosphodiesterase